MPVEYYYAFVLANGIKKVFLSLYLSEGCNRFLLGSISQFEFNALWIITTLLLDHLSSKVSKFSDVTIGVTLVNCEYSLVMNLAALFWICSNFLIFSLVEGSHTADAYSSIGLTNVV